ncbi:transglycosylase SLT domain-containing protein [uncultured Ferrimonas sp.]|uniref:transglycosylase SLT domain-containing protein n=1 Tax=uncultured Ferrimonas sp. TaxID=432640 RepID=UPI0026240889|nr:transglycosylase SLT domain-containing protein [uncultured Ferrimonas sp.]
MSCRWLQWLCGLLLIGCSVGAFASTSAVAGSLLDAPLDDVWPVMAQPSGGDLDEMVARGEIRVLTTFTLGWYYIDRGQPNGITYHLTQLFEQYARRTLGQAATRLKVTVIPVRRDQLLEHLRNGHGDLIFANLTITPSRLTQIDFSDPVSRGVKELWISGPKQTAPNSWTHLSGKQVVVRRESSYYDSLVSLNQRLVQRGYAPATIQLADPRLEDEDLMQMVAQGYYPATVVDAHKTWPWRKSLPQMNAHDDIVLRSDGEIAYGLRQHSPQLMALLNGFVSESAQGSKALNLLVNRFLKTDRWVKPALEQSAFSKAEQLIPLFQKYASQYQFDWVLLMSFAYQESRFDVNARSSVGAVGIMQVMPATARDKKINIRHIERLENNIHAGTKYLALLRQQYFADDSLSDFNRTIFSMAAYNAGPNRINRLRRKAIQRGLDGNAWFNNVEDIVAAEVGAEPINYVANIYRFYIIYKRVLAESSERETIRQRLQPGVPEPTAADSSP